MRRKGYLRSARTMPKEHPLKALVTLEVIGEAESVLLVAVLEKVQDLG